MCRGTTGRLPRGMLLMVKLCGRARPSFFFFVDVARDFRPCDAVSMSDLRSPVAVAVQRELARHPVAAAGLCRALPVHK